MVWLSGEDDWAFDSPESGSSDHLSLEIKNMNKDLVRGEITIRGVDGNIQYAYIRNGGTVFYLREKEHLLTLDTLAENIQRELDLGILRCTSCGIDMSKDTVGGYPLFAGMVCVPCWNKHLEHAETEKKTGHVCRMCNKPYSFCCC
jgi:hypothetical protein